ncbi:MAG: transcriptional regulator, AsnC family [Ilumatobacteraceae bacterium]|nr:transcriptional regulator, AsnC family [Ilumatobacteraceae bacterium]
MSRPRTPLDAVDRSIVELLQRDGRMAFTAIATAIGLTEGAVRRRVQRLTDTGAMQVVAVTDPVSLGDRRVALLGIRITGGTDDVAAWVGALPEVEYLVATAGRFDLMFEVIVEDEPHLLALLSSIRQHTDVAEVESFPCLKLYKQTFAWGT